MKITIPKIPKELVPREPAAWPNPSHAMRAAEAIRARYKELFKCPVEMMPEEMASIIRKEALFPLQAENEKLRHTLEHLTAEIRFAYRDEVTAGVDAWVATASRVLKETESQKEAV